MLDSVTFGQFKPWNNKAAIASWKDYLKEIYRHVDSDYIGSSMVDLLRFHRNVYQHYIHVKCRKRGGVRVTIEEVDADVRCFFPGFLDLIQYNM